MDTMRRLPPGSRFHPTELGLVKLHLKNKVEKDISGFIKTLNVYGDVPWRLEHDTNPLYPRNQWYYFVKRTIRGKKTVSRVVPRNGEGSLGGTWKTIGRKQEIKNKAKDELMGYKNELVFNENVVVDGKPKPQEKTNWHMDEYSLHTKDGEYHDLILCHVRLLHTAERFKPVVVPAHHQMVEFNNNNNNVVLQNQEQQEEAGFANHNNDMVMVETNQQQEQDSLNTQHLPFQSNVNQEHYLLEDIAYHSVEDDHMTSGYDGLVQNFNQGNNVNQQHEQQEAVGFANHNDMMMAETNQQQQQQEQQDSPNLQHTPMQINNNLEQQCPFITYHGAEDDDMTSGYGGLTEIFNQGNINVNQQRQHEQQHQDSLIPFQTNVNLEQQCPFAFDGAENNMTSGYGGLMDMFNQGNINVNQQQQEQHHQHSPALHPPPSCEDCAFDGADDNLTIGMDLIMKILNEEEEQEDSPVPLQSNDDNNNNTLLPNQDQQEANQNDMSCMVAKEHGDVKQEQEGEDLMSHLLAPFQSNDNLEEQNPTWDDDLGFGAAEDDWIMQNIDDGMEQRLQELEKELSKVLQPPPQAQDSEVDDADQDQ